MAQFTVRNLEEDVKARLKRRAARHGWSMEEEVRQILRNAVKDADLPEPRLGSRIAARFARVGIEEDLPEVHSPGVRPAEFPR
jgi:plasmid stability protein